MTAPKQAEAVMTSIPKFVSSIPEKPVAECNPYLTTTHSAYVTGSV